MSALSAFNDSEAGRVLSTVLHTGGALVFLAAFVAYVVWARHLRHGKAEPHSLLVSQALLYVAIVANLVGGFLRTYQSDHPKLTSWADSPWVRVLAIKHVFLFVAMGCAIYLTGPIARRLTARFKEGASLVASSREKAASVLVVVGVAVAALLGAVSTVTPLGIEDVGPDPTQPAPPSPTVSAGTRYYNTTGQLSLPGSPPPSGTFEVAQAATSVNATLLWQPEPFCLELVLVAPGEPIPAAGNCSPVPGAGRMEYNLDAPESGTWSWVVRGNALGATWQLFVRMPAAASQEAVVADTVTIAAGTFHEINTEAPLNATLHWDWTSDGTLHFNLHSHFDDEVQEWVDTDSEDDSGHYLVERAGGYSYLWENTGTLPVTVTYRVWGPFVVESIAP